LAAADDDDDDDDDDASWRLDAVALALPRAYVELHGREVSGIATPWASEVVDVLRVDIARIVQAVHAEPSREGQSTVVLTSPAARTGDFTYVHGASVRIYEAASVQLSEPDGSTRWIAVLGAGAPPDELALDDGIAEWTVALVEVAGPRVATVSLRTAIPFHVPAMWDSISTAMTVSSGALQIEIGFAHTGGGDPCDQVFTFDVRAQAGLTLRIVDRAARVAPCR
jgi:hypothetical protein